MSSTLTHNYNRVIINPIVWLQKRSDFISKKSLKSPSIERFPRQVGCNKTIVTGGNNGCDSRSPRSFVPASCYFPPNAVAIIPGDWPILIKTKSNKQKISISQPNKTIYILALTFPLDIHYRFEFCNDKILTKKHSSRNISSSGRNTDIISLYSLLSSRFFRSAIFFTCYGKKITI